MTRRLICLTVGSVATLTAIGMTCRIYDEPKPGDAAYRTVLFADDEPVGVEPDTSDPPSGGPREIPETARSHRFDP